VYRELGAVYQSLHKRDL